MTFLTISARAKKLARRSRLTVMCVAFAGVCAIQSAAATPPPPRPSAEAFGQLPFMRHVQISPDGSHFAAIQQRGGEKVLVVYDISGPGARPPVGMTFDTDKKLQEEISYFFWPNNERLIVVVEFPAMRGGSRAIKTMETRMASISRDFSDQRQVPKQKKLKRSLGTPYYGDMPRQIQDNIITRLPGDPNHILLAFNRDPASWGLDAFKMNVADGGLDKILNGNENVTGYMADQSGDVRLRGYYYSNEGLGYQLRTKGSLTWNRVFEATPGKAAMLPLMFTPDPNQIYVQVTNEVGRRSIKVYDFAREVMVDTLFSNDLFDVGDLIQDPVTGKAVGTSYIADMPVDAYFDPAFAAVQRAAERTFPASVSSITSRDKAGEKWIVYSEGPRDAGAFYIYIASQNKFMQIGMVMPHLKDATLFDTSPLVYEARDGLEIHGYLTEPETPAPHRLIVMPHGGPTARSTAEFDWQVQFLASRGYAVFQPNFRGSNGYGFAFERAGYQQWGLAMQDDITDGVHHLVAEGIADPDKMCIVGASYGGYAALMGTVVSPDLFNCAVSVAGVSDLRKFMTDQAKYRFDDGNYPELGDSRMDKGRLRQTSPIFNIDKIKTPILLVHGKKDRAVFFEQSQKMYKALRKAGKSVDYVEMKKADHHLSRAEDRIQYLKALEAFLAENIGG